MGVQNNSEISGFLMDVGVPMTGDGSAPGGLGMNNFNISTTGSISTGSNYGGPGPGGPGGQNISNMINPYNHHHDHHGGGPPSVSGIAPPSTFGWDWGTQGSSYAPSLSGKGGLGGGGGGGGP